MEEWSASADLIISWRAQTLHKRGVMSLTAVSLSYRAMDCKLAELRAGADLTRTWIHMDMDAFFASVEELDDPSLVCPPHPTEFNGVVSVRLCETDMMALLVAGCWPAAHEIWKGSSCDTARTLSHQAVLKIASQYQGLRHDPRERVTCFCIMHACAHACPHVSLRAAYLYAQKHRPMAVGGLGIITTANCTPRWHA